MTLPDFAVTNDTELIEEVRDKASYDDLPDEWPQSQAESNLRDAKRVLYIKTGSDKWYNDTAYGHALIAMTALKAKEAVENINIASYGIGDESLRFSDATPDESQQIQSWSQEVEMSLNKSDVGFPEEQDFGLRNTSSYIG